MNADSLSQPGLSSSVVDNSMLRAIAALRAGIFAFVTRSPALLQICLRVPPALGPLYPRLHLLCVHEVQRLSSPMTAHATNNAIVVALAKDMRKIVGMLTGD